MLLRKSPLLLLAFALLLGACSRVDLAYRNLDRLIPWKLGDYVALNDEQNAWFKPQLEEHLAWHCSVELPRYLDWLTRNQALLDNPDSEVLAAQLDALEQALQRIAVEITPSTIALLRSLNPRQVAQLLEALEEQNAKLREEFLEPSLEQQVAQRAERMEQRLQRWLGGLNAAQQARIEAWSAGLGTQNQVWMDNRLAWQRALREALEVRRGEAFEPRMTALLQQRERFYTETYKANHAANRRALAELLDELLAEADERQLSRARQRLGSLHADLAAQQCPASRAIANR